MEDPLLLAVDKPPRLAVAPSKADPDPPHLIELLHQAIERRSRWFEERGISFLAHAHRLDTEASGVLLLARDQAALSHLTNQFGSEQPLRVFVALVHGHPRQADFQIKSPIGPDPLHPGRMKVDPGNGKKAVTHFTVRERFRSHALLECRPLTDRPHQISVHLRAARLPLVGASLYGGRPVLLSELKSGYRFKSDRPERPLIGRSALHGECIQVHHPGTNAPLKIEAPWPKDLAVAVKYLRRYSPLGQ
jgi:RluA family pseudouridine synthase